MLGAEIDAVHAIDFPSIEQAIAIGIGIGRIGAELPFHVVSQFVAISVGSARSGPSFRAEVLGLEIRGYRE